MNSYSEYNWQMFLLGYTVVNFMIIQYSNSKNLKGFPFLHIPGSE